MDRCCDCRWWSLDPESVPGSFGECTAPTPDCIEEELPSDRNMFGDHNATDCPCFARGRPGYAVTTVDNIDAWRRAIEESQKVYEEVCRGRSDRCIECGVARALVGFSKWPACIPECPELERRKNP